MLIRTQDKTELVNVNNVVRIILINDKRIASVSNDGSWTTLGYYPEEKALKVLDMIQEHYYQFINAQNPHSTINASTTFQMPEVEV